MDRSAAFEINHLTSVCISSEYSRDLPTYSVLFSGQLLSLIWSWYLGKPGALLRTGIDQKT